MDTVRIDLSRETRRRLRAIAHKSETWDQALTRLMDEVENKTKNLNEIYRRVSGSRIGALPDGVTSLNIVDRNGDVIERKTAGQQ